MVKFYLRSTGKEVRVGDDLLKILAGYVGPVILTDDLLSEFIKEGIIITKSMEKEIPMEPKYYIQKIADRLGWKFEKVCNYLDNADLILPAAAFSMVLREIAVELDKKYEDHIENSPEIYVISMFDGRITKANKAHIKNYRNFAAFRSISDAKIACKIMRSILKDLFQSGK